MLERCQCGELIAVDGSYSQECTCPPDWECEETEPGEPQYGAAR